MLVTLTSMGPELQSQNRFDFNYEKKFSLRAIAYKITLEEQYLIDFEQKGEVISSKIHRLAAISNYGNQPNI